MKSPPPDICLEVMERHKGQLIDLEELKCAFSGMLAWETSCSRAPRVWGICILAALQSSLVSQLIAGLHVGESFRSTQHYPTVPTVGSEAPSPSPLPPYKDPSTLIPEKCSLLYILASNPNIIQPLFSASQKWRTHTCFPEASFIVEQCSNLMIVLWGWCQLVAKYLCL